MFMAEGLCSDIFSQSGLSLRFQVSILYNMRLVAAE